MKWWWGFWIRVFFWTQLRTIVNGLQRLIKGEPWERRAELMTFDTPEEVEKYVSERFKWRADGSRLGKRLFVPLDYITNPRVFQARLEDDKHRPDGDCDDVHTWIATVLKSVSGVTWAYTLSCVWKKGGHTTCLYEYKGSAYLFNYKIQGPIEVEQAPELVVQWANAKRKEGEPKISGLKFWVLETLNHRLLSATPGKCRT